MVPGGGLEFSCPAENKEVIENYASNKRPKLPIRGYLVRIRYTPLDRTLEVRQRNLGRVTIRCKVVGLRLKQ